MKLCCRCRVIKPLAEFNWKNKAGGKRSSTCRECMRLYIRDHYQRNTSYYLRKASRRNKASRKFAHEQVHRYLESHPCVDCGEGDPVVLEFDHRDGTEKEMDVSVMIHRGRPWEKILVEIEKCDVRCANCHRRRTAEQQGWMRGVLGTRPSGRCWQPSLFE